MKVSSPLIADLKHRQQTIVQGLQHVRHNVESMPTNQNPWAHPIAQLQADINKRIQKGNKMGSILQQPGRSTGKEETTMIDAAMPQLEPPDLLKIMRDDALLIAGRLPMRTAGAVTLAGAPDAVRFDAAAAHAHDGSDGQGVHYGTAQQEQAVAPAQSIPRPLRSLGPSKVELLSTTVPLSPRVRRASAPHSTPVKLFEQHQAIHHFGGDDEQVRAPSTRELGNSISFVFF